MAVLAHHVLLALAVLALADAALRVASRLAASGLERAIAAAVLAVAVVVAETLALGLVSLGGNTVALAAAAAITWLLALAFLPKPALSPVSELALWWRRLGTGARLAASVLAGIFVAWVAWQLRHPSIGFDSAVYHYPEVADWIANGHPGSMLTLSYDIPYGNYPLTDEVALTWGSAIARSWIPIALWNPAALLLLGIASWQTLRNFAVPRVTAGLGTAALIATPLIVHELNEPQTDLPAIAWLACTAALASGARRRPALLLPAFVAAGLAIGTKTSTGPMAIAALGVGLFLARGRLQPLSRWLALGVVGAYVAGGIWYTRNLFQHGSPFWPFAPAPWGDKSPQFFARLNTSLIERPVATLSGRLGGYTDRLGGGWILLVAALVVLIFGVAARRAEPRVRRPIVVASALALVGFLVWSTAWATGLPRAAGVPGAGGWPLSTVRYLLPAVGASVIAVALVTRARGRVGRLPTPVFIVAIVWSVVADVRLGAPYTPSLRTLVIGALAGALCLGAVIVLRRAAPATWRPKLGPVGVLAALAAVAAGAVLAPVSNGYLQRYAHVDKSTAPGADVLRWLLGQRQYTDGHMPVAFASRAVLGPLAGDHFTHRLTVVAAHARCSDVIRLAHRSPVVATPTNYFTGIIGENPYDAAGCLAGLRPAFDDGVYKVYWVR
jgi:hypothetical protein